LSEQTLLPKDSYAVVEVLGHNVFAGKVSEHVIGGSGFIRVDVPELPERREKYADWRDKEHERVIPGVPAFTKLIGAGSIYAITPCTEEVARRIADQKRVVPVHVADVPGADRFIEAAAEDGPEEELAL
jgi:hypothetical protein